MSGRRLFLCGLDTNLESADKNIIICWQSFHSISSSQASQHPHVLDQLTPQLSHIFILLLIILFHHTQCQGPQNAILHIYHRITIETQWQYSTTPIFIRTKLLFCILGNLCVFLQDYLNYLFL